MNNAANTHEIFISVFGPITPEQVLADAAEADRTPQDYIMSACFEAKEQGMLTDVYEAKDAICEACGVPRS